MQMSLKQMVNFLYRWCCNVFLKILRLKRRDEKLWLFGSWRGEQYSDNAKYLFEYVCEHNPEIRAVWITKKNAIKEQLTSEGKPCYLSYEKDAKQLILNAGMFFFTHGYHDFGEFDFCQGGIKVYLGHGMPLKRAYFATNFFQGRHNNMVRLLQYYILKIHNKAEQDITIASSLKTKEWLSECYETKFEHIIITGQPRNDVLFNQKIRKGIKQQLMHQEGEKFVLYMPTWRDTGKYDDFTSGNASFLAKVVEEMNTDDDFMERLIKERIKLYVKPHPNRTLKAMDNGNMRILHHQLKLDIQELLAAADVLITDYSSAFIDFALTDRPIHFYVPDLEEFKKGYNGLFLSFEEFAKFWFKDIETFKKVVFDNNSYMKLGLTNTEKINKIYDDKQVERGSYCKNVVKAIKRKSSLNS